MNHPTVETRSFGTTADGRAITACRITGSGGAVLDVLDWGGKVNRLDVPDRAGKCENVAMSLDFSKPGFGGSLIGRYANRITRGEFELDGVKHRLPTNVAAAVPLTLHGGADGFHDRIWAMDPFIAGDDAGVRLAYTSPDGEGGFPGTLAVEVVYTLTAANVWRIAWKATCDRATPVNFTHHVYFNLSGEARRAVTGHLLTLDADAWTPLGEAMTPTGEVRAVAGTDWDFTRPTPIGARQGGMYDYNFCLRSRTGALARAAVLEDTESGRKLETWTTEPGLQLYAGGSLGPQLKDQFGRPLAPFAGCALETQGWPDSVNRSAFPNTILRPGETFRSTTEYRFSV